MVLPGNVGMFMKAMNDVSVSLTALPMTKLRTITARYSTMYLLFFGQLFKNSITHLKLIYAQISRRRWSVFWAFWMCVEGAYVFRHRNRCDCPPNPTVQFASGRLAIANRLSSV